MIDKELIRQAAEDIDLFEDDFSAEFDKMCQSQTRTGNVSPNRGLGGVWPYVAAACIVFAVIFTSIQLFEGKQETIDQRIASQTEQPPHPWTPQPSEGGENREGITGTETEKAHTITPTAQTLAVTSTDSPTADEMPPEEDAYSEELLCALIAEVEANAMAEEEAREDRIYHTLLEEITHNIEKQTIQTELTL